MLVEPEDEKQNVDSAHPPEKERHGRLMCCRNISFVGSIVHMQVVMLDSFKFVLDEAAV